MTTEKQKELTQAKPQESAMETPREHSSFQPKRRKRAKPGMKGEGDYFRIIVRTKDEFATFRTQDVGEKGHILRLAGKRSSGSWDTQAWLISKDDAHIENDTLVADTDDARGLIEALAACRREHGLRQV